MKSKDQQMLEEAYNDVIKKMMAGANNPGWSPERSSWDEWDDMTGPSEE